MASPDENLRRVFSDPITWRQTDHWRLAIKNKMRLGRQSSNYQSPMSCLSRGPTEREPRMCSAEKGDFMPSIVEEQLESIRIDRSDPSRHSNLSSKIAARSAAIFFLKSMRLEGSDRSILMLSSSELLFDDRGHQIPLLSAAHAGFASVGAISPLCVG